MLKIKREVDLKFEAVAILTWIAGETESVKSGKAPHHELVELCEKYGFTAEEKLKLFDPIIKVYKFVEAEMANEMNDIGLYFVKPKSSLISFGVGVDLRKRLLERATALGKEDNEYIDTLLFLELIGREGTYPPAALSLAEMMAELNKTEIEDEFKWRMAGFFADLNLHTMRVDEIIETAEKLIKPKLAEMQHFVDSCVKRIEDGETLLLSEEINIDKNEEHIIIPSIVAFRDLTIYSTDGFEVIIEKFGSKIDMRLSTVYCGVFIDAIRDKKQDSTISNIDNLFAYLKAITDMTRLRILKELTTKSMNGREIAQRIGITQATVSHHMNELFMKKFITIEKQGTSVFYSLNNATFAQLVKIINELFG